MRAGWPSAQYDHSGGGRGGGGAAGVDTPAQVVQASAGEPPVKRPGRCVVAALERGQPRGERVRVAGVRGLDHLALEDGEDDLDWFGHEACTGRCTRTAFGQAAAIRSIEAWPRWDDPLPAAQNTRRAGAYGSAVITWFTKAVNGAIPVVGSTRPISRARCTS
jgi:hypothetical protein